MAKFLSPIFSLLTGGNTSKAAEEAAARQEALTRVAQDNQKQALQAEEGELTPKRAPRGRRLLIARETGERGLSSTLGG